MNLKELTDLITIRSYVVDTSNNGSINRATVTYMNNLLLLLDKKIIALLGTDEFKEYVDFKDVKKAIEEVVNNNNIKSGLWRNPNTGQLEKISK